MLRWGPAGWSGPGGGALKSDSKLSSKSLYPVQEQAVKPVEHLKRWRVYEASRGKRTRKPSL